MWCSLDSPLEDRVGAPYLGLVDAREVRAQKRCKPGLRNRGQNLITQNLW